jgi:hypothetical protein
VWNDKIDAFYVENTKSPLGAFGWRVVVLSSRAIRLNFIALLHSSVGNLGIQNLSTPAGVGTSVHRKFFDSPPLEKRTFAVVKFARLNTRLRKY